VVPFTIVLRPRNLSNPVRLELLKNVFAAAYLPDRAKYLAFLDIRGALVETGKKASRRAYYRIGRTLCEIEKMGNVKPWPIDSR